LALLYATIPIGAAIGFQVGDSIAANMGDAQTGWRYAVKKE